MKPTITLLAVATLLAGCGQTETRRLPTTASESVQNHALACDQGDPVGCYALALVYKLGEETHQGVPRDIDHARGLFRVACNAEIPEACAELE